MFTLKLQNYRRFLDTTELITFEPGLTIISGPNGSGKSTLVESIKYALFGPKRGSGIRSDNANATQEVLVECELIINGQKVKIIRVGSHTELWVNDIPEVEGGSHSTDNAKLKLNKLLGITQPQFEKIYLAEQGDTIGLADNKAKNRKEIIDSILQFDIVKEATTIQKENRENQFKKIRTECQRSADELGLGQEAKPILTGFNNVQKVESRSERLLDFQAKLKEALDQRQKVLEQAQAKTTLAKTQMEMKEKEKGAAESAINLAKTKREEWDNLFERYNELTIDISGKKGKLDGTEENFAKLTDQVKQAREAETIAQKYISLVEEIKGIGRRLDRYPNVKQIYETWQNAEEKLGGLNLQIAEMGDPEAAFEQAGKLTADKEAEWNRLQQDPTATDFASLQKDFGGLETEEEQAKKAQENLVSAPEEALCPTCGQELKGHALHQRQEHLEILLKETLPARRQELMARQEELEKLKKIWGDDTQKAKEEWENAREVETTTLQRNEAKIAWESLGESEPYSLERENQLGEKLNSFKQKAQDLEPQANLYRRLSDLQKELEDKKAEKKQREEEISELSGKQTQLNYSEKDHKAAEAAVETAQNSFNNAITEWYKAETSHKDRQGEEGDAGKNLERTKKLHKAFGELVEEFYRQDKLLELMEQFEKQYFVNNTAKVAERASDLLRYAITDQTILGIKFNRKQELEYLDASSKPFSVDRLSGGEKALVGLCLRIALAEQAQKIAGQGRLHFLILDEVLGALDDERREAVERIFEDVCHNKIFEYLILITHLDIVKQSWNAHSIELEKVDAKSSRIVSIRLN